MRGLCIGAIILILCASTLPTRAALKLLTFEDLRRIVTVSSPTISPDGKEIVYVRSHLNWKADREDSELVLIDVESATERVLTHDRIVDGNPQWSPDGTRIAYLASPADGKPSQLYVLPMNGGDSLRITNAPQGVLAYAWRPDGGAIAFTSEDEALNKTAITHHLDAVVITDEDYLTQAAPVPAHLWLVSATGGEATRLTSGTWSVVKDSAPVWAADGSKIYYQRQPDAIFAHFVSQTTYAYDIASRASTNLGFGVDQSPRLCGDGSLAILAPRHGSLYLQNDVSQRSASGTEIWNSRDGVDRNVHFFDCSTPRMLIGASDRIRSRLWVHETNGATTEVDLGDVDFGQGATVNKEGAVAFVGQRQDRPGEVYYLAPGATTPRQLTNENAWLAEYALPSSQEFASPTDIGTTAYGVLTYPVNYEAGRKYPLILDIHGGPVSTSTWAFNGLVAILASHGFFVFRPNYRGSDNLGDAFLQAIVGDVTSGPGRDNLAAVDALRKTGMIDDSRIGVSGWSGGGLQTSWLIGHAQFWRAAVMGAAVTDWYEQATLADIGENFTETFFAGVLPFTKEGRAKYDTESPLTYVKNVRTPTLILSDTRDQRVPVAQAFMFYHALRDQGTTVTFTAFPRYGHFATDPVGSEQTMRAWAGWFDRWMR